MNFEKSQPHLFAQSGNKLIHNDDHDGNLTTNTVMAGNAKTSPYWDSVKCSVCDKLLTKEELKTYLAGSSNHQHCYACKQNGSSTTNKKRQHSPEHEVVSEQQPTKKRRTISSLKKPIASHSIVISPDQERALQFALEGNSFFLTGEAGTGKSFILRDYIVERLKEKHGAQHVFVTSSSGTSATDMNGTTLHSFAGIGLGQYDANTLLLKMRNKAKKRWKSVIVLIIDEISMIDAELFNKLNHIACKLRGNNRPFGGIQVIVCGDFFQLPPVWNTSNMSQKQFCFESAAWKDLIGEKIIMLTTTHRQQDPEFLKLLREVRVGKLSQESRTMMQQMVRKEADGPDEYGIRPTILHTHRVGTDSYNQKMLDELRGEPQTYKAVDDARLGYEEYLVQIQQKCQAREVLQLKPGAQVMFLKNHPQMGICNGSRGVVKYFTPVGDSDKKTLYPFVQFKNGLSWSIDPEPWQIEIDSQVVAHRIQVPLLLAWSLTAHKSQGWTMDSVHFNLNRSFERGQIYVGMSRVRSREHLTLSSVPTEEMIRPHPRVLEFYESICKQ